TRGAAGRSTPGPNRARDGRCLPRARASLERVEEAGEAEGVVGEAVLAGEPHARLVRGAHHRRDRPHQRAGLRPEGEELACELAAEPRALDQHAEPAGILACEHPQVAGMTRGGSTWPGSGNTATWRESTPHGPRGNGSAT